MPKELIFQIEKATANDLTAMTDLLQVLFSIEQDFIPNPERQRTGLQQLLEDTQRARVLVARLPTGEVIGLCSAQLVISTAEGGYSVWIEDVIIASRYRGNGVGKALLQTALDWAAQRGATRAQLLADRENISALQFYQKLGWQETRLQAQQCFLNPD